MAQPLELVRLIAAPQPDVETASAEDIRGSNFLGDDQRMMQRQHHDRGPDADALCLRGKMGREHQRPREIPVGREVMLRAPDAIEAEAVGGLGNFGPAREHFGVTLAIRRLQQQEGSKIHIALLEPACGDRSPFEGHAAPDGSIAMQSSDMK